MTTLDLPAEDLQARPGAPRPARPSGMLARARRAAVRSPWQLLLILLIQAGLTLRLTWSNTAFSDEALYIWAGRVEWAHWLHGAPVPDFATYFSGAPVIYPPLAALAAAVGGLAGARILSLCFMLAATCLLYGTAGRLYGRTAGIGGAAVFAVFGMTQVLGDLATYDALAICSLALATWLAVRANGRLSEPLLFAAAVAITFADSAKYASALWNPVIFVVAGLAAETGGFRRRLLRGCRLASYVAVLVAAALVIAGHPYVHGLMFTTVTRNLPANARPETVLLMSWGWLGALVAIAAVGVILSWSDGKRRFALAAVLLAAAALAPLEQARISTDTSLHKHVVFGAWFACISGGYAIQRLSKIDIRPAWTMAITLLAMVAVLIPGLGQARFLFGTWPPFTKTMPALASAIAADGCPCYIYASSVSEYYRHLGYSEIVNPSSANLDGLTGMPAVLDGIARGYYGVVEIDGNDLLAPKDYQSVQSALLRSTYYKLVSSVPWVDHPATPSEVWERVIS